MLCRVVKAFKWSPNGYDVLELAEGEQDLADDCAAVAMLEGWAVEAARPAPAADEAEPVKRGRKPKAAE